MLRNRQLKARHMQLRLGIRGLGHRLKVSPFQKHVTYVAISIVLLASTIAQLINPLTRPFSLL